MPPERSRQIRISDDLWNLVGDIAQELGYEDKRGAHSGLIREMVAAAAAKWRHSPYVCRSARLVVFVTKNGEIFYRMVQILKLNSDRQKLPCSLEMKPEKKLYYQRTCPPDIDQSKWFRSRWLLNYFSVWQGRGVFGRRLSHAVDRDGIDSKIADLPVNLAGGRFLTREIIVGIRDYVQWDEGVPGYDRADFPIDIPTHELAVVVVVDEDLYRYTATTDEEIPALALEFRNRESAKFPGKDVVSSPEMKIHELLGRFPQDELGQEVLVDITQLKERIAELASMQVDGAPIVAEEDGINLSNALKIPRRFLFYSLNWRSPHLGVEACVRWEKPIQASQASIRT